MDSLTYTRHVADLTKKRWNLHKGKSSDYAGNDILSNFKRLSEVAGILRLSPEEDGFDYAMFMALLKIDRIMNLYNEGKEAKNESVEDSFMDLLNYIELAYALYLERGTHGIEDSDV